MKAEAVTDFPGYLFVVPWELSHVGGVNEVVKNLYRELESQGLARPMVLVPRWECRKMQRQCLDGRNTFTFRMPAPPPLDKAFPKKAAAFLASAPTTAWQLYSLIKDHNIAVVNPHFPGPHLFHFALLKKWFPQLFRFVISFHGSDVIALEKGDSGRSIVLWTLANADAVTVPSRALGTRLANAVPAVAQKIICIYNGIAAEKFLTPADCSLEVAAENLILHVGSFERIKGQDILLHAFKEVLKTRPDARLLMVGRNGSFLHELERLCADLGIAHAVSFMKDVAPQEIPPLMAGACFLVMPSRYEGGIPLVILEAGAVRKTVVASDAGGIGELIAHGENGLLVPVEDPAALAKGMVRLLGNEDLREQLAKSLHCTVSDSFSWTKTANSYLDLATKYCATHSETTS